MSHDAAWYEAERQKIWPPVRFLPTRAEIVVRLRRMEIAEILAYAIMGGAK